LEELLGEVGFFDTARLKEEVGGFEEEADDAADLE
jgi:hypothetical protein